MQVVAGFIVEFTIIDCEPHNDMTNEVNRSLPAWSIHVDGVTNEHGCEAGLILMSLEPESIAIEYAIHLLFRTTNNEAKYEALLVGLRLAKSLNVENIHIYNNSQLIVK